GVGGHRRGPRRDGPRPRRRDPGGVVLQLPHRPHRVLQRRNGQLVVGARGLLHQEDGVREVAWFRVPGYRVLENPVTRNPEPGTQEFFRMAMDLGGAKGGIKSDINVTPLVDVMLVLLIIMMLVAPLLQQGISVKLPTASNTVDKPDTQGQTVIAIGKNKELYLNAVPVREGDLATKITEKLESQKEKVVLIKADEEVEYGAVMATMDQLRTAGIEDIGLVTERKLKPGETAGGK